MKTLVIGSGGREHALLKSCLESKLVDSVIVAPGNGGISREVRCVDVKADDLEGLVRLVAEEGVEFVIIGPEVPLSMGLTDRLEANGVKVYGPNKAGAELEASKVFAKHFLKKYGIATAVGETFMEVEGALKYLKEGSYPVVVKASGLAAGKGVIIAENYEEAEIAVRGMLEEGNFGESGDEVLIEKYLEGEEVSIMLMVSGEEYVMLAASQDHKRIGESDTGLNTGGMGAYAPADVVTQELEAVIKRDIIERSLKGLKKEGIDFRGTLFIGLMLTKDGPQVLEYNVRFGDPETEVLLPLMDEDVVQLMVDAAEGNLKTREVKFKKGYAMCVVQAAEGYPEDYKKGDEIRVGIEDEDTVVYYAGVKLEGEKMVTNGGRVMVVTGLGATLKEAANKAYGMSDKITFKGKYCRRDIGWRQLEGERSAAI